MRKTWIIACAAAAVALAGCNRETQGPVAVGNVFRASIETPSRVAFSDEGAFSWQAGDAVAVSTNAGFKTFTLKEGAGASVAAFDGDLAGVTSATVAVYPASIAKADATVTLPAEYAWTEGQTNAAMYCDAVDLTKVNNFKHLGGIIKVSFAEIPAEADAMVLKAEAKITGDFAIADGKIAAGVGTDEVKVTFTAGSNPAAFYIPVPTGEYKFAVELQAAGVTIEKSVKATSKAIKIDRKALVLMDPVGGPVKITIATVEDFLAFAAEGDTYPEGSEAVLTADITLPETFVPDTVAVNFDGQGHTITYALTLPEQSTTAYNGGVFSLYTGTMKNLKVAGTMSTETLHVGGIAGACGPESVFDHCESSVNITFPAYGTATPHLGGIVGNAGIDSQFIGCVNKGKLEYNVAARDKGRSTQIGGIAAYCLSRALFKDCVNDGDLVYYAKGSSRLGGMVGYPDDPIDITFDGCVNNGHILVDVVNPASGYQYVGGLTGYYATNSTAVATAKVLYKDCVNNGKVEVIGISTAKGQARIGGIASYAGCTDAKMESAGFANGSQCYEFDGCVNNGEIITDGTVANNTAGGIVGFAESSAQVICKNCTNKGKVSVAGSGSAGGIQGAKGGLNTVYTDCVVDAASVIEALGAGKVGLLCGNAAAYTGTFTGTIGPAAVGNNGTQTVMASDNYKDFLFGAALGEGANTDGVVFEGGSAPAAPTIKDFAQEFVKILDVWESTTGEGVMHSSVAAIPNAHLIPADTKITVGGKEYSTADMMETAMRSYMLIRGYNGLDTENYGAGKIAALEGGAEAMSTTEVPATHEYYWGEWPCNETSGNGGHLVKVVDGKDVPCQADVVILDNWAMRAMNFQHGHGISNMCTYPRDPITNYKGSFSAMRALITYAFFFKYMLDNNLDKADGIGADVAIRSELFGDEAPAATLVPSASKTEILSGETVQFSVDATAQDVKWTWKEGDKDMEASGNPADAVIEVAYPCENNDIQTIPVTVTATVDGATQTGTIELKVKPYAIFDNSFEKTSTYQGFYGMAPIFSPDGKTVYIVTSQGIGSAYAYSTETFERLWSFALDGRNQNSCAVNPVTGDLYVPTSNTKKLYAITASGSQKWVCTLPDNVNQRGMPAINKAGSVVYITAAKHLVAVNTETGAILWDKALDANANAVAVNGSEIILGIAAAATGIQFLSAADGSEIASIDLPENTPGDKATSGIAAMTAFAVAADGKTAYVGGGGSNNTNNGMVYMIDIQEHKMLKEYWINETCTNGSNSTYEPVISPVNGDVFIGNKDSRVYCFDKDLNGIKWSYAHLESTNNAFNYSHPCVDADGNFMISAGQESPATYIFSPTGAILKKYVYAKDKDSTRSMAGNNYLNGILYTLGYGASGHDGYFIAKYVGGNNPTGSWVRSGGDLCGSNCIK